MNRSWRYNQVAGTFWQDRKIRGLSEDGRTLAIYLLTGPCRVTEGFYSLPLVLALDHLVWSEDRFRLAVGELSRKAFAEYDFAAEAVFVCRALKYQPPMGVKSIRGACKALDEVHDAPALFSRFLDAAERYAPEFAAAVKRRYDLPEVV